MHRSSGGGYCDCGDEEAWSNGAWCRNHAAAGEEDESTAASLSKIYRSIEDEQITEMEKVKKQLAKLPPDIIKRCNFLLKPLINSASVVLFELIQVRLTNNVRAI